MVLPYTSYSHLPPHFCSSRRNGALFHALYAYPDHFDLLKYKICIVRDY